MMGEVAVRSIIDQIWIHRIFLNFHVNIVSPCLAPTAVECGHRLDFLQFSPQSGLRTGTHHEPLMSPRARHLGTMGALYTYKVSGQ